MSLIYIFGISSKPEAIKMIFKLIPMWLILFYAYKLIPDKKSRPHWIIWCGLFFCMLGDGLMCWTGFLSQNIWAIIGSILFVLSDSILSWNLFVSEIPYSDILIMTTYYTAQFLIAHSLRLFPSFGKYSSGEK
ncbi:lysoplasmalogenase family protein [Bacillus salipaludis]